MTPSVRHFRNSIVFLGVFFLLNALAGRLAWHFMLQWAGQSRLDQALESAPRQTDTLVMGDSHPLCAVDDRYLPRTLNLAKVGHNYDIVYGKLEEILTRHPGQIRVVILPLDYHGFARDRVLMRTGEVHMARYENTPYLACRTGLSRVMLRRVLRFWLFPHFGLISREYGETDHRARFEVLVEHRPGGLRDLPDLDERLSRGLSLHFGSGVWWEPVLADYLGWTLDLCARHNVRVALVRYPVSDAYLARVGEWIPVDAWEERACQIIAQHEADAVLDYRRFFEGRDECFVDGGHVHKSYAPEFTRQLRRDLECFGLICPDAGHKP